MTTNEKDPASPGQTRLIALRNLLPSATNPRSSKETKEGIEDLVRSVRERGILVPLMVRRLNDEGKPSLTGKFEIIAGHRRHEAAVQAGLTEVPCLEYAWTDEEVKEAQLIENLQRKDLHPMDEAVGFVQLVKNKVKGYAGLEGVALTLEDAAKKVGKPVGHVKRIARLVNLIPAAQAEFRKGTFGVEVAFSLARIGTADGQETYFKKAMDLVKNGGFSQEEISRRISDDSQMDLSKAPFDGKDPDLVKKAGPCTTCPKRAGNQPELFAEVNLKRNDLCTDPVCFKAKVDAAVMLKVGAAKLQGIRVLTGDLARAKSNSMIGMDEICWRDPKNRKWSAVLKGVDVPKTLLIYDDYGERQVTEEKMEKADVLAALKADGQGKLAKSLEGGSSSNAGAQASERAAMRAKRIEKRAFGLCLEAIVKSTKPIKVEEMFRALGARLAKKANWIGAKHVAEVLGLKVPAPKYGGANYSGPLAKLAMKPGSFGRQIFLAMFASSDGYEMTTSSEDLKAVAGLLGISPKSMLARAKQEAKDAKKKRGKGAKKGGKK